jgi:hypothetical protein
MTTKVNKKSLLKERLANSKVIENLLSDAAIGKQVVYGKSLFFNKKK